MGRLDDKVALITGAARGQGEVESRLFSQEGAKVVLTDVLVEQGQAVAASIQTGGGEASFLRHDVANPDEWTEVVGHAVRTYGRLDILINNAGIALREGVLTTTVADWDRLMDINLKGVFLGMQAAIPAMLESGGGSIINISSTSGIVGFPGGTVYHSAKGGVRLMTKATAAEVAKQNIRVNSIHPGLIETPMTDNMAEARTELMLERTPMGRKGTPMEIAYGALFLASDESSFMTGTELVIDGGMTAV